MADQDDEIIDQNDIDKLLEASSPAPQKSADEGADASELSQDDIDALMDGGGPAASSVDDDSLEDEEDFELELISQDDINQLVKEKNNQTVDTSVTPEPTAQEEQAPENRPTLDLELESEEEQIPSARVKPALLEQPPAQEEFTAQATSLVQEEPGAQTEAEDFAEPAALEDGVIDESESLNAEECLVTQESIDQLIKEDNEAKENIVSEQEVAAKEEVTTQEEVGMEEEKKEEDTVDEKPASDGMVVDLGEDDDLQDELENIENDELQGDIDDLLDDSEEGGAGDDEDWEQDSLISQDDIEELIKSSENEDEDALGDLDSPDPLDDYDGKGREDNKGEDDDEEEEEDEEADSKVILEEAEEQEEDSKAEKKSKKKKKKRSIKISKKLIVIAASVIVFIGVGFLAGFYFLKGDQKVTPNQEIVSEVMTINDSRDNAGKETVVKTIEIDIDQKTSDQKVSQPMSKGSLFEPLVMKDFVILAPDTIEDLAYIEADINIDYSNNKAYYEIKENMPFYRDVVYLAVKKALDSAKGNIITEPDLLAIVKKALIKALPPGAIKRVGFNSFKAG